MAGRCTHRIAPHEHVSQYQHNRTGEDNADAQIKRQIMGRNVVVAVMERWRRKRVLVKIIGEQRRQSLQK